MGALIDVTDSSGDSCFHYALKNNNIDMLKLLLNKNPSAADSRNKNGETVLMSAAINNKLEFVNLLRQYNVSLDLTDHQDTTLLHVACKNGSAELFKMVMSASKSRVSMDSVDRHGRTALIVLSKSKHPLQVQFAETLLNAGSNLNLQDNTGKTGKIF